MADLNPRHELFVAALRRGELTLQELWLRYIGLTGTCAMIDLDAFLHGLSGLPAREQDILAHALNERLDEMYQASRVPYLTIRPPAGDSEDPLAYLQRLLGRPPTANEPDSPTD
jgi:hypothetical protein